MAAVQDGARSMMPAAVYQADGSIRVEQLPVPEAASGQALIEVSHCGICGRWFCAVHADDETRHICVVEPGEEGGEG